MKYLKKIMFTALCTASLILMAACGTTPGEANKETPKASEAKPAESTEKATEAVTPLSEEEAWKLEKAYGTEMKYFYDGGNCTSAVYFADVLGYYKDAGLNMQGFSSNSSIEALGTNAVQLVISHISTMLVPATNGVDLSFVAGAHVGCKSLYVLSDSGYNSTADLKGLKISAPNGIGASDYNILARFFDKDGINPLTEVSLIQVETSACVTAMQNGDIAGALLSDTFAYKMVKEGLIKPIRSLLDDDFLDEPCCVVAMNASFVKENPITAKKVTESIKKASEWMRNNPEEAVQRLLDDKKISGDFDMNVELWKSLNFGLTDEFTKNGLSKIAEDYIKLGLITAYDNKDEVMSLVWTPAAPDAK